MLLTLASSSQNSFHRNLLVQEHQANPDHPVLTTVMGIVAAFGKINLISSNLPRLLKFSAIGILKTVKARQIKRERKSYEYHPAPLLLN